MITGLEYKTCEETPSKFESISVVYPVTVAPSTVVGPNPVKTCPVTYPSVVTTGAVVYPVEVVSVVPTLV